MNARSISWVLTAVLLLGGGLYMRQFHSGNFHQKLLSSIRQNIVDEFARIENEAAQLIMDHLDVASPAWDRARHFFVHVDKGRIIGWNRTSFLPELTPFAEIDSITFVRSPRGDFLLKRWNQQDNSSLFCILQLTDRYPIINNFLSSQWEPAVFPIRDITLMLPSDSAGDPILFNEVVLFKILPEKPEMHESTFSFLLLITGVFLLLAGLWKLTRSVGKSLSHDLAFIILLTGLLLIRLGMIAISLPALYFPSDTFDPKKFASSSLNASLGDLLLNALALLAVILYLFVNISKFRFVRSIYSFTGLPRNMAGVACLLICFFALLFPYDFVESIYHNSILSFDIIHSFPFDTPRLIALASVLTGCVSSFLFIHIFFSLGSHLFGNKTHFFFLGLLIAATLFILQAYATERNLWATLILGIIFFTVLKLSGLTRGGVRVSFQLFIYLIFSLITFSVQNAWAVCVFYTERQVKDQFRFGKDFLTERDVLGEYLLHQASLKIRSDQFIQTRMVSPFLTKAAIIDKIRRVHLNNYFDRYEISISTRNEDQVVSSQMPLEGLISTDYDGISYATTSDGNTVKRYHVEIPVYYQRPAGAVILDLSLKRVIPDNVYPELLVDNRFNQMYRNRDFSYAVFRQLKLISSFGSFNYERDFNIGRISNSSLYGQGIRDHQYHHIGIEDPDGSVAIVSATTYSWFNFITNFSFWFVLGLTLLFAGQGTFGFYSWLRGQQVKYSARIQLFIFLAFLLPVVAVSITTLTLIGSSNEEGIKKDYLERSLTISQRIGNLITESGSGEDLNLETWIEENAASSKIDISVYSPEGKLLATSQPALFDEKLISPLLEPEAWKKIVMQRELQAVTDEQIGKLKYSCAYSAVLSAESGKLEAIVGLPFFGSAAFLEKSQSLILSNILLVFVVVFILFSVLSYWASRSLTFPIRFITKTLGQTTLTGQNKPLQWNSSDEIGTLVKEYNRMLSNLEESKLALAKSEKEIAWREMARQVAHEIKNPLTPMKLTLQQMEQALRDGHWPPEKSQKALEVLLKQVEILNEIAASFSMFASMPAASPRQINLYETLQEAVNLFAAEGQGKVTCECSRDAVMVSFDPTSFSRAISNMIINSLQSKRDGQDSVEVRISAVRHSHSVVISIQDNGRGIPPDDRDNVFQPYFTTKKSGSGLGLAMTRQIVMQAGGKIWFESEVNRGTTFFIELPVL